MNVIFDTGSPTAWVYSESCKASSCPPANAKYLATKSSMFKVNDQAGQFLQYGKGAVAGHPATDRICFSPDDQCVDNMSFLSVISSRDVESL